MRRCSMSGCAAAFVLALVAVPVAAAQTTGSAPGQRGPVGPMRAKPALPDLTIPSAKVSAKCANGTVTATIDATVKNGELNGTADLSKIPFGIVMGVTWFSTSGGGNLDPAPPLKPVNPQLGGPKTLKPGESWSGTMTVTGMPRFKALQKAGTYGFSIEADPTKAVTEADEKNNTKLVYATDPCFGK